MGSSFAYTVILISYAARAAVRQSEFHPRQRTTILKLIYTYKMYLMLALSTDMNFALTPYLESALLSLGTEMISTASLPQNKMMDLGLYCYTPHIIDMP